ncbi:hypothetical protein T4A_6610 [Trichinella pseudospiralis]|uniref:Uncharacterized protein n=1 Tax=Trichinella pseudospiralis TaxID=6337 RepID=A0A0V1E1Y7_TRIPS|nr:hypothetical protein T4A_6610 [Trichinella pseudospiralis]
MFITMRLCLVMSTFVILFSWALPIHELQNAVNSFVPATNDAAMAHGDHSPFSKYQKKHKSSLQKRSDAQNIVKGSQMSPMKKVTFQQRGSKVSTNDKSLKRQQKHSVRAKRSTHGLTLPEYTARWIRPLRRLSDDDLYYLYQAFEELQRLAEEQTPDAKLDFNNNYYVLSTEPESDYYSSAEDFTYEEPVEQLDDEDADLDLTYDKPIILVPRNDLHEITPYEIPMAYSDITYLDDLLQYLDEAELNHQIYALVNKLNEQNAEYYE